MRILPAYDLDKIKFATDGPTFERAVGLYDGGKVTKFKAEMGGYSAVVLGTKPYRVFVSSRDYDRGSCKCYLGQRDTLCKHMVALAIMAVKRSEKLSEEEKRGLTPPQCSGRLEELSEDELAKVKRNITEAMKFIKPYSGPSRIWFQYQDSLQEGCNRLSAIICNLPVSEQTARLLVDLLLRLDKKLRTGGVDDSDGTVGGLIEETVAVLEEYAKLDPACIKAFGKLKDKETCFGWEELLIKIVKHKKGKRTTPGVG